MKSDARPATLEPRTRLRELVEELRRLEAKLRRGGGPERIEHQHQQGKHTARERLDLLLDKNSYAQETGLLVAYDEYKGQAPAAGVVTMIGRVGGRETVVVANDATVKAGSWWPETIKKILRAQEISMRSHVPIIYLVDSAGVNLPFQGGVFPGHSVTESVEAARPSRELYDILPEDHRQPYDMREVMDCLLDGGHLEEFQADYAREMICGHARIRGIQVGIITNSRGMIRPEGGGAPRFGGIVYTESAEKVAYFIETCNRHQTPLLFIQDVSGFMVGSEAEHSGIIRAGARFVEAMATAVVPKIVLTINHASGAGYYAMAGQGFDPDFIFTWPTGRMGVMEGESAVSAVHGPAIDKAKQAGKPLPDDVAQAVDEMRADYEHQLDAKFAAARGYVDAIVHPEDTRHVIATAL